MKCNNSLTVFASILVIALLSGCASSGITEYRDDQSRAWNLTHSVGMTQLDDSEVSSDQIPSTLFAATDMAIDVGYFMNSQTLNMSFGDAFGLGLIGALSKSKGHGERSTLVAWIPENEVKSRETANLWLGDQIKDATMKAMKELGIEGDAEFHNREVDSFFRGTYSETKISGVKANGTKCGVYFKIHPENISEVQVIPDFIAADARGHQLYAGNGEVYPMFKTYCWSESDAFDQRIEFINEISKNLPETVYFYSKRQKLNENQLPPMVYDHGKALLFLTIKD